MDSITPQPEQSQYQAPIIPEHKHFLNKKFAITFVVLLLLGGGAYAGISYWQNQQVVNEVVPTFSSRPLATADPNTTADWKTYTNTQYGFEFKYPADWDLFTNIHGSSADLLISLDPHSLFGKHDDTDLPYSFEIQIYKSISQLDWKKLGVSDFNDFLDKYSKGADPYLVNIKLVKIGDKNGFGASAGPNVFGGGIYYYLENRANIYEINFFENGLLIDQILSTFKFTNQGQTACTKEAKQCPDGSYVGRTGPNCEFATCPK